tara:strand:+ start:1473 stop:1772 length:300 start_codon:yes stop_codon:yes gene_type:complete
MYKLLSITTDTDKKHKLVAVFENKETKRKRTVHFGQYGADDYTLKKDVAQRAKYLERHGRGRENWNDPVSKGSLSRFILWGDSTSIQENIKAFKKKFNL